jgi:hypothetical protein
LAVAPAFIAWLLRDCGRWWLRPVVCGDLGVKVFGLVFPINFTAFQLAIIGSLFAYPFGMIVAACLRRRPIYEQLTDEEKAWHMRLQRVWDAAGHSLTFLYCLTSAYFCFCFLGREADILAYARNQWLVAGLMSIILQCLISPFLRALAWSVILWIAQRGPMFDWALLLFPGLLLEPVKHDDGRATQWRRAAELRAQSRALDTSLEDLDDESSDDGNLFGTVAADLRRDMGELRDAAALEEAFVEDPLNRTSPSQSPVKTDEGGMGFDEEALLQTRTVNDILEDADEDRMEHENLWFDEEDKAIDDNKRRQAENDARAKAAASAAPEKPAEKKQAGKHAQKLRARRNKARQQDATQEEGEPPEPPVALPPAERLAERPAGTTEPLREEPAELRANGDAHSDPDTVNV